MPVAFGGDVAGTSIGHSPSTVESRFMVHRIAVSESCPVLTGQPNNQRSAHRGSEPAKLLDAGRIAEKHPDLAETPSRVSS